MSKMSVVDPRLKKFHKAMRDRLALPENQAKPDWRHESAATLAAALRRHVDEMGAASIRGDVEASLKAAENVANFAFIFHDVVTWLRDEATPAEHLRVIRTCLSSGGPSILPPPLGPIEDTPPPSPKLRRAAKAVRGRAVKS